VLNRRERKERQGKEEGKQKRDLTIRPLMLPEMPLI
jgi:hypothetical protein